MQKMKKIYLKLLPAALLLTASLAAGPAAAHASAGRTEPPKTTETAGTGQTADTETAGTGQAAMGKLYREYRQRLDSIQLVSDLEKYNYRVIRSQVFTVALEGFGEVTFLPALDRSYSRLALFFADAEGKIVYQTDQLEANCWNRGELRQPIQGIAAVAFQDLNGDGLTDIALITSCRNQTGEYAFQPYKVGDVLFQGEQGFYRDWRLSDKINRFGMNKSVEAISAFVKDGESTEFLYTAVTLEGLQQQGFQIISEQCYWRQFKKMGRLQVVPGVYTIADYDIFMIYLVNEQGYIVWSFQPMGDYDNLYSLKGMTCRDIDGDGLKDIVVLARYSYEGKAGEMLVDTDYAVYYQRTGGFSEETEMKGQYRCGEDTTLEELVEQARAYWGWKPET